MSQCYRGRDEDTTPRPSLRTGLADFPHPALQLEISRIKVSLHVAGLSAKR